MCCTKHGAFTKNRAAERSDSLKQAGMKVSSCCKYGVNEDNDLNLLQHRLECFTEKISNIKLHIEELATNNK
jgi:hypothetical protein